MNKVDSRLKLINMFIDFNKDFMFNKEIKEL